MLKDFEIDISANGLTRPRKRFWVLWCIGYEQHARNMGLKRFFALIEKVLLFGTGCELSSVAFQGDGMRFSHVNGIVVSDKARIGSVRTIFLSSSSRHSFRTG